LGLGKKKKIYIYIYIYIYHIDNLHLKFSILLKGVSLDQEKSDIF
jgi:hypothetical protein